MTAGSDIISFPILGWQVVVLLFSVLGLGWSLVRYLSERQLLSGMTSDGEDMGVRIGSWVLQLPRDMNALAHRIDPNTVRIEEVTTNVALLIPQRQLLQLQHLGVYWWRLHWQENGRAVLELRTSVGAWGMILLCVAMWATLTYRMPRWMPPLVLLVFIPDVLTLVTMLRKTSKLAKTLQPTYGDIGAQGPGG